MNFSISFSDTIDIGFIITFLWFIVTEYISMYKSHQDNCKLIIALSEESIKTEEQNNLLKTQNNLLREEINLLKMESEE